MNAIKLLLGTLSALTIIVGAEAASAKPRIINLPEVYIGNEGDVVIDAATPVYTVPVYLEELHYWMAVAVGANADAAFENAIDLQDQLSWENAVIARDICPTDNAVIREIAGGYITECIGTDGVARSASINGMRVTQ